MVHPHLFIALLLGLCTFHVYGFTLPSISPPTFIQFLDPDNNPISGYSIQRFDSVPRTTFVTDGTNVLWSISPEMPPGIVFSYHTLSGSPTVATGLVQYNVTASNSAGSFSTFLELNITDCPYGPFMYFNIPSNVRVYFEFFNDAFFLNGTLNGGSVNRYCLPYNQIQYVFNATWGVKKVFGIQVMNERNTTYAGIHMKLYEVLRGMIDFASHTKPTFLSPPTEITAYTNETLILPIQVDGAWNGYHVNPPFSESYSFDPIDSSFSLCFTERGIESHSISFFNDFGSSSFHITFKVDMCDSGEYLVVVTRTEGSDRDSMVFSSEERVVYATSFSYSPFKHNLCLREGLYDIQLVSSTPSGGWSVNSPLILLDSNRHILATELLPESYQVIHKPFRLVVPIPSGSSFRYFVGIPAGKWNQMHYRDHSWKEGKKGEWVIDPGSKVFFRKAFVSDTQRYSQLGLNIQAVGKLTVYLNGELMFSDREQTSNAYYTLPASLLRIGQNLLAIQFICTNAHSECSFDLSLQHLVSSCLFQSLEGTASDDQLQPDPSHPPSAAFDQNTQTFWSSSQFPVSLDFSFANQQSITVNQIILFKDREESFLPTQFIVEGVISKHLVTPLYRLNSTLALRGKPGYVTISFTNHVPFNTYRIRILDSFHHTAVRLSDIRLYGCIDLSCKQKGGFDSAHEGSTSLTTCPLTSVGVKQGHCVNVANQPLWIDDRSACLPRWPLKGYNFLDWSFRLYTVSLYAWNDLVHKGLSDILTRELTVKAQEISYPFVYDASTNDEWIVDVWVRFTLEVEIGSYVKKHIPEILSNLTNLVREQYPIPYPNATVEITKEPILRFPFPLATLIWITVCVLLIIVYLVVRRSRSVKVIESDKWNKALLASNVWNENN